MEERLEFSCRYPWGNIYLEMKLEVKLDTKYEMKLEMKLEVKLEMNLGAKQEMNFEMKVEMKLAMQSVRSGNCNHKFYSTTRRMVRRSRLPSPPRDLLVFGAESARISPFMHHESGSIRAPHVC